MSRSPHRPHPRGQGLVEFGLILPVLALLLVMALDFGRVFFGWVALQNTARVAADYAALNSRAWTSPDEPSKQAEREEYDALIEADAGSINCTLAPVGPPTFTDAATGAPVDPPEAGDHATVRLDCAMTLLTPLASAVLGGGVNLSAEADFAVHRPEIIELPEEIAPPPPPGCASGEARVPNLVGMTLQKAWEAWDVDFETSKFAPALVSSGPGNNKNKIVTAQNRTQGECLAVTGTITVTIP